ncbi:TraB/GumN family protein [Albirhodobacter sp. R86504]|uniref:TraB/GumN family protein n=1 Tax=Albirhodobacter sp. R86504 TaxID=3093848 RepID=UPI003672B373
MRIGLIGRLRRFGLPKRRSGLAASVFSLAVGWGLAADANAHCAGVNLMDQLPPAELAQIRAAADAAPYAKGLVWRATKAAPLGSAASKEQSAIIIGTYHLDDPRHAALLARIAPVLDQAASLLVEAGPKEESRLQSELASRPDLMFDLDGPTLPELLDPADWERLTVALEARGIPPIFGAKFKPWYAAIVISMSPCAMQAIAEGAEGLDKQIMHAAQLRNLPIRALESYDTAFHLFEDLPEAEQRDLVVGALAVEGKNDDMTTTLADAYFKGETRLIWEFSDWLARQDTTLPPEVIERQLALSEDQLMVQRNHAWVPVIEAAAATAAGKPVVMAAGALHLAGEDGVLNLLAQRGWTISPY